MERRGRWPGDFWGRNLYCSNKDAQPSPQGVKASFPVTAGWRWVQASLRPSCPWVLPRQLLCTPAPCPALVCEGEGSVRVSLVHSQGHSPLVTQYRLTSSGV